MKQAFASLNSTRLKIQEKHLPFFLYNDMPAKREDGYHLPLKWGARLDAINYPKEPIRELAKGVGLDLNFEAEGSSTFDSHRLLLHAEKKGKAGELREELGLVYFQHGQRLADHSNLLEAAAKVGLDTVEAAAVLSSDAYATQVAQSVKDTSQRHIHSIPVFFIESGAIAATIHGSSSVAEFLQTFREIEEYWENDENRAEL